MPPHRGCIVRSHFDESGQGLYISAMPSTYSVAQAQAQLPELLRKIGNDLIVITRRDKTVAYLISAQRMEAIVETLEVIADPEAMRAVRRARAGKGKYYQDDSVHLCRSPRHCL
jgi:PHD/YefM family antitoxin component YafN of YafNO toxin-antitoxin module